MRILNALPIVILLLGQDSAAQTRQSTCIWSQDFEQGLPADWSTNQVERQGPNGEGLGEFVPAFRAGTASEANAGGFFPVPDAPIGNRFAMANDDAAPCNCDLDSAVLATPSIDLSSVFSIALDLRVFHTRALGGGEARIEFSANGGDWLVFETIPSGAGWQQLTYNLSLLGGVSDLRLRFNWSDSANWASGFALDDLCIREQLVHDLAITGARLGDATASPFVTSDNGLGYRLLPLEQSRPLALTVDVHNLGIARLHDVAVSVIATQNGVDHGPYAAIPLDSINSGDRATVVVQTDWAPDALGEVTYSATASSPTGEEDAADNSANAVVTMTGQGWDDGYGTMALDAGSAQGNLGSELGFIAANRFELSAPGTAYGISAVLGTDSQQGELIRAIIMDASFAFIDTSERHAITAEDIELAWGSGAIRLPFVNTPSLAAGDYFVGLQRLSGNGRVSVATSGNCPEGAAAFMEGITFDITWSTASPMVRLHLDELGVGIPALTGGQPSTLSVFPQPLSTEGYWRLSEPVGGAVRLRLLELSGRLVRAWGAWVQPGAQALSIGSLPAGAYVLEAEWNGGAARTRVIVAR